MTFYKGQKILRASRKKHPSATVSVRTTLKQRKSLVAIRRLLAEEGYQIYPVATWFRRTTHDFVAVPRLEPQQLLVVRPAKANAIEFRYFAFRSFYNKIKSHLDAHKEKCGRMVWGTQLPAGRKDKGNAWRHFISRNCLFELKLFTNS